MNPQKNQGEETSPLFRDLQAEVSSESAPLLQFMLRHAGIIAGVVILFLLVLAGTGIWRWYSGGKNEDARQELATLPTPAALKELYPDTSSLDARITRALHTLHHPQKALHRALAVVLLAAALLAGPLAVSAEARHAVYTALLRFLPIEMQVTYSVDGTPLDTLPENYCDHYVPEGFVLDEENSLSTDFLLLHGYHTTASANGDSLSYTVKCYPIQATGQIENEHTTWSSVTVKGHSATLGTSSTASGTPCYFLFWESDGIQHTVSGCIDRDTLFRIAESIF